MLQLQQAVVDSRKHLLEVFTDAGSAGLTLEGVELSEDMKFWLVTFSYWPLATSKKYKTVKMRAEDGVFLGIKPADLSI